MEDHYDLCDAHVDESLEHYVDIEVSGLSECPLHCGFELADLQDKPSLITLGKNGFIPFLAFQPGLVWQSMYLRPGRRTKRCR
jgi:hypothetical protein